MLIEIENFGFNMPISSGFGSTIIGRWKRGLKKTTPSDEPISIASNTSRSSTNYIEVYKQPANLPPPDPVAQEKLVIVKPTTIEKIETVPVTPTYIVQKEPKKARPQRVYERVMVEDTYHEGSHYKGRCCKSVSTLLFVEFY